VAPGGAETCVERRALLTVCNACTCIAQSGQHRSVWDRRALLTVCNACTCIAQSGQHELKTLGFPPECCPASVFSLFSSFLLTLSFVNFQLVAQGEGEGQSASWILGGLLRPLVMD
jgi:hypothetical protein